MFLLIGVDPLEAATIMLNGAFGYQEGIGYTPVLHHQLHFHRLAKVAVAFHAGLFNIGGEGQAYIGGLGSDWCLALGDYLPGLLLIPLAIAGAALFGAAWAFIPGYLQAYRGSHIVITTIMFNFLASSLMVYLLVDVIAAKGQMQPSTEPFAESSHLPMWHEVMAWFGVELTARR
ncbi:MAG: hypothetical protein R3E95_22980 [Thiolinea sp.]